MKKLDKLYMKALRQVVQSNKRLASEGGYRPGFHSPDVRAALIRRAKGSAESILKLERQHAAQRGVASRAPTTCPKDFLQGYLTAALWASTDNSDESGGESLDENYDIESFTKEAIAKAKRDCSSFYLSNKKLLDATGASDEQNGHDFWLTRERHGTGFWDRGYGSVGDALTKDAHVYGGGNIYVSRGRVHFG
jgi:hypothetical protein